MGAAPHAFQIIVITFVCLEDVDDGIAVIHQHPTAFGCALYRRWQLAICLFDLFAHTVGNGAQLTVTVTGTNDEVICNDGIGSQVEEDDIFGLFIFYRIDDKTGEFN